MTTLLDRIWDAHVVDQLPGGHDLLYVDRHVTHDLIGPGALTMLQRRELRVRRPDLTFAAADHCVSTAPGRTESTTRTGARLLPVLHERCGAENITLFDMDSPDQGIVHVVAPEQGITLPGTSLVCGDSHTCTNGALGALAWGIGTSEVVHALATQCVVVRRPPTCLVQFTGTPAAQVTAKDLALALISRFGTGGAQGYAVEYAGPVIDAMSIEERMTLCNLSIEFGAKIGMVAPDEITIDYVRGRPFAPSGDRWDAAVAEWRTLRSDSPDDFDKVIDFDVSDLAPQVTWGTSPETAIGVGEHIPAPTRQADHDALDYMALRAGSPIAGTRIDRVFIGSCTNARLSDLQAAARIVEASGARVPDHVEAWVVPGSQAVKRDAEALGLREVFVDAGFHWREPGCSMCLATNEEYVGPGERCVSTSNRNFVGRQGPESRTHLSSPATAAASALAGAIADPRAVLA